MFKGEVSILSTVWPLSKVVRQTFMSSSGNQKAVSLDPELRGDEKNKPWRNSAEREKERELGGEGASFLFILLPLPLPVLLFMVSDLVSMFFHYYSCFCNVLPEDDSVWLVVFSGEGHNDSHHRRGLTP